MELEKRIEVLEKRMAELEGRVQEQPSLNVDRLAEIVAKNINQSLNEANHDIFQEYHR